MPCVMPSRCQFGKICRSRVSLRANVWCSPACYLGADWCHPHRDTHAECVRGRLRGQQAASTSLGLQTHQHQRQDTRSSEYIASHANITSTSLAQQAGISHYHSVHDVLNRACTSSCYLDRPVPDEHMGDSAVCVLHVTCCAYYAEPLMA